MLILILSLIQLLFTPHLKDEHSVDGLALIENVSILL